MLVVVVLPVCGQVVSPKLGPGPHYPAPAHQGVVRFQDQTESSDPLPAPPARKSHSKSQRGPASGDINRRRATVCAVQMLSEPCLATPGDAGEVAGVKGSPVQIRPSRRIFRTLVAPTGNEICRGARESWTVVASRSRSSIERGIGCFCWCPAAVSGSSFFLPGLLSEETARRGAAVPGEPRCGQPAQVIDGCWKAVL
jgi:hypothetical protein